MIPHDVQRLISLSRRAGIVTLTQFEVLAYIATNPGEVTHCDIYNACGLSKNSGSKIAQTLEGLEFVTRRITPAKSGCPEPSVFIAISPLGRAWLASVGVTIS